MSVNSSPVRQFARSSGIMALLYAGSTGLSFLTGVVLARLLGASGYGTYALALTTATLIGLVTEFGLPVLAMREAGAAVSSGHWGMLKGLLAWSDRAIVGISLLLVAGTVAGIVWSGRAGDSAYLATMLWAVALVPLVALGKLRSFVLLAFGHVASSQSAVMILRPLAFLGACLLLWALTGALTAPQAMAAQAFGAFAALVAIAFLFVRLRPRELGLAVPERNPREWLAACLPMGLTEGLRLLQGQIALLLTGWLAGTTQAGIYRVADGVALLVTLVTSVVGTAATPMFGRLFKDGDLAGIQRIAAVGAGAMAGGAFLIGAPLALVGHWILPLVFGPEFVTSAPVFTILWVGFCCNFAMGLAQAIANMTGHHVLTTQSFAVVAISNLALGVLLVPTYGAQGAAIASAVSSVAGSAWCAVLLHRRSGINSTLFSAAAWRVLGETLRSGILAVQRIRGR